VSISYASEDGPAVARPLAEALRALGVTVWLDELQLAIGNNLRRRIDRGIASSRFAAAVFAAITYSRARFGR
jgi:hypothetical protein